jgi:hypothetical protein
VASRPYEELVVLVVCMNLWGLALVLNLAAHRQERNKSAEPVTNKPSATGKATMGVKYEFDSWFKGGIAYNGSKPYGINQSKVTKNKVSFITPTAEFNAEAGVGLMFGCEMIIDKLAGPELAVGPELTASAGLTIAPFEKDPVNFEASVDFGIKGEVGAKIKVWKWALAEWTVPLDFGLNWNIFKYPKDNSKGDKNAEDYCNDNFVQQNVEEINKNLKKQIIDGWNLLAYKLNNDSDIKQWANQYLSYIKAQRNEFNRKYGRAPMNVDADYQTLKQMTIGMIKNITEEEIRLMMYTVGSGF